MSPSEPTPHSLTDLFRYTRWANERMLDALRDVGPPEDGDGEIDEALTLFSHLLRAQSIWWGRVTGDDEAAALALWEQDDLDACAARSTRSINRWQDLLASGDLTRTVRYRNSSGTAYENTLRDLAHHVVNHGTHHRAQIARLLRQSGLTPPGTDYIFYLREKDRGA
jgi:uncharacterized damage-inducible protein DinB